MLLYQRHTSHVALVLAFVVAVGCATSHAPAADEVAQHVLQAIQVTDATYLDVLSEAKAAHEAGTITDYQWGKVVDSLRLVKAVRDEARAGLGVYLDTGDVTGLGQAVERLTASTLTLVSTWKEMKHADK